MIIKWEDTLRPSGCFSRGQFAFFYLVPIFITVVFSLILQASTLFAIIAVPWFILQVYVVIVAGIRRLHDINYSGWVLLLGFIPFANLALIIYLLLAPGKDNRWSKISEQVEE